MLPECECVIISNTSCINGKTLCTFIISKCVLLCLFLTGKDSYRAQSVFWKRRNVHQKWGQWENLRKARENGPTVQEDALKRCVCVCFFGRRGVFSQARWMQQNVCDESLSVSLSDPSQDYTDSTGVNLHEFLVNTLKNNPRCVKIPPPSHERHCYFLPLHWAPSKILFKTCTYVTLNRDIICILFFP